MVLGRGPRVAGSSGVSRTRTSCAIEGAAGVEAGRAPRAGGPTTAQRCSTRRPLDAVQAVHRKPSLARDSQGTRAHCRCPPKGSSQGLGMGTDWVLCWDRVHQMRAKAQGGLTGAACRGRSRWMAGGWASRPGRVVCEPSVAAGTTDDQDKGRKDGRETKLSISQWKRAQGLYTGQERTHVRRQIGLQSLHALPESSATLTIFPHLALSIAEDVPLQVR